MTMPGNKAKWIPTFKGLGLLAMLLPLLLVADSGRRKPPVLIHISTELGDIEVELYADKAPVTTANFLRYVDTGAYTGGQFHRTVRIDPDNQPQNKIKIEVIQGSARTGTKELPPIPLERTSKTGVKHLDGTISMARDGPDTATQEFFVCIGDQPELDFGGKRNPDGQGFAAFGKVVRGMDVVRQIHRSSAQGQRLTPTVKILRVAPPPATPQKGTKP